MWLIARRSFAANWGRLTATLCAALFSVALIAGTLAFALRAQDAVSGSDASAYARTDVLVQGGSVDTGDPFAAPDGTVRAADVASLPGVAAVAGDAELPVLASGADGKAVTPPAGSRTLLRPWVADAALSPYRLAAGRAPERDGEVAVVRHFADAGKLGTGSTVRVGLPDRTREMTVVGVVTVSGAATTAEGDLLLAPPGTVRAAAGLPAGSWPTLWVKAAPGTDTDRLRAALERAVEGGTVRDAAGVREARASGLVAQGAEIAGGIGMLTGVAVFVGLFVVAGAFAGLVRQRTRTLALLGAVGATPRQLAALIRLEALVLGLLASVGGGVLGYPVADVLTRLFARDGFDISVAPRPAAWLVLGAPLLAGVLVTQLAVWRAARRAALIAPMEALRESTAERAERRGLRLTVAGLVFGCAFLFYGPVPAVLHDDPPGLERTNAITALIVYGSMVVVCALAVLGPLLVRPVGGLIGLLGTAVRGEVGRLARTTLTRSPQRVATAASSLMLGVALVTTSLMVVMSADGRFQEAGGQVMRADHAVSTGEKTADGLRPLPRDLASQVQDAPGVRRAVALTSAEVRLVEPGPRARSADERPGPLRLTVTGAEARHLPEVLRLGGSLRPLRAGEIGLPSTVMKEQRLRPGQRIVVRGAEGERRLTVAGAYHDPSHLFADGALVAASTMDRLAPKAAAHVVLVRGGTADAVERAVAGVPGARVFDRAAYVDRASAAVTEGTTVIYGFLVMTLILAVFGTAATVSMGVAERKREFGLLSAVGATARQIRSIVRWEAAAVVALGTLLGLGVAVGTVLLVQLATGSSFVRADAPWWLYAAVAGGAAAVALGTSALPARRAAAVPTLDAAKAA